MNRGYPLDSTALSAFNAFTMKSPALAAVILLTSVLPAAAQARLQLRWEAKEKAPEGEGAVRMILTLTNQDTKPLPATGWALYFNSLGGMKAASFKGGLAPEHLTGDLYRLVPTAGFDGIAPGKTREIEYVAELMNMSSAPTGPYVVFDDAPAKGYAVGNYTVAPIPEGLVPGVPASALYRQNDVIRDVPVAELSPVFPTPVRLDAREGRLHLSALPTVSAGPGLEGEAALVTTWLRPFFGPKAAKDASVVKLEIGGVTGQSSPEAYELTVDPKEGVRVLGNSAAGVFYGLQTVRGLLPAAPRPMAGVDLPALRVVDAPRFGYRGLHLDVARNFQPKAAVLKVLDLMGRYKLNAFHFHLTEDEGWRVEIAGLPELTAVGARRGHTLKSDEFLQPAFGSGPDVDQPFGSGFYTRSDYIEILKYAAARHIEVVPEIEMPGHARAAIKAMEARYRRLSKAGDEPGAKQFLLSDPNDASVYTSAQGYGDNVMNPALPSTYAFIEKVVAEVARLHEEAGVPLRNMHMGGDEVPAGVWEKSPVAQAYLKDQGLGGVDDLWFVFYGRVEEMLKPHGITPSGWEEIGVRKTLLDGRPKNIPNPGFAGRGWRAYVWNNTLGSGAEDLAYRLANGGYKVVLCPVSNLYFDLAYNRSPDEQGLDWGGHVDIDKPFDFVPYDYYKNAREDPRGEPIDRSLFIGKDRLTEYGRQNIVGVEGCLWSETLRAAGRLDYMLVPKLLALAERAWAPDPEWAREADAARADVAYREAWSRFVNVLGKRELPRLDQEGVRYRIPKPGLKAVDGQVLCNIQIPGLTLRYTTDGSEPSLKSPGVAGPILTKGTIKVAAFDTRGRKGFTAQEENR
jgi:hexosaminidase